MTFRTASDGTSELLLETPQAKLVMPKMAAFESPVTVAELMSKVIAAAGGEENLRKHSTRLTKFTVQYENQGLTSEGTTRQKAPALKAETEMLSALGKNLDATASYVNGKTAVAVYGGKTVNYTGADLEQQRILADF